MQLLTYIGFSIELSWYTQYHVLHSSFTSSTQLIERDLAAAVVKTAPVRQPLAEHACQLVAAQRRQLRQSPLIFVHRTFPTRDECRPGKICSPPSQISVKRKREDLYDFSYSYLILVPRASISRTWPAKRVF